MINADVDYQRVALLLAKQQLAPYVSYTRTDKVNGLVKQTDPNRVVVRVSDGKIIAGDSSGIEAGNYKGRANPVSHPSFDPTCYRATNEHSSNFNGADAIQIDVVPACKSDGDSDEYPFRTLYVNPSSMQLLDARGSFVPSDDSKSVRVSLDQTYDTFQGRNLPSRLKVDVTGSGLMFWLQLHVTETYTDYGFSDKP